MNSDLKQAIYAGVICAVGAGGISWLVTSDSSPLDNYLTWHPRARNAWYLLTFPSYLAGALVAGNPHTVNESVAWSVLVLQWFGIGFLVAFMALRLKRKYIAK